VLAQDIRVHMPLASAHDDETDTATSATEGGERQGIGSAKRSREEDEAKGDALRGDLRKQTICDGLKLPLELSENHIFLYMPIWHKRIVSGEPPATVASEWKNACMDFVVSTQLTFNLPCKRQEFFALKESITSWLTVSAPSIDPSEKSSWRLAFDLTNKMVSLIGYACGSLADETDVFTSARAAWTKGFVDYSSILSSAKNGTREQGSPKYAPQARTRHRFNDGNNNNRARYSDGNNYGSSFRGRGQGFRGRGRGKRF
jgi:hypothetical protein